MFIYILIKMCAVISTATLNSPHSQVTVSKHKFNDIGVYFQLRHFKYLQNVPMWDLFYSTLTSVMNNVQCSGTL